jgi:hypothetical protein
MLVNHQKYYMFFILLIGCLTCLFLVLPVAFQVLIRNFAPYLNKKLVATIHNSFLVDCCLIITFANVWQVAAIVEIVQNIYLCTNYGWCSIFFEKSNGMGSVEL